MNTLQYILAAFGFLVIILTICFILHSLLSDIRTIKEVIYFIGGAFYVMGLQLFQEKF